MALRKAASLVWITGAAGLIGSALANTSCQYAGNWNPRPLTREDLDLTDFKAVSDLFRNEAPGAVIHCAALSRSSDCQAQAQRARLLNVDVTAHLADLARDIPFFLFSTDLVFNGRLGNYDEHAAVNPLSTYAETKVAAEQIVLTNPKHSVIRTSLNGGRSPSGQRGFNEEIERAWAAGRTVTLFSDEFRSPIAAECTARAVWDLLNASRPGLYHVAGAERLSRYQIGQLLAARWPQLNPRFQPASLETYTGAPRAPDTSLNCAKAQALLSFALPRFSDWLAAQPPGSF